MLCSCKIILDSSKFISGTHAGKYLSLIRQLDFSYMILIDARVAQQVAELLVQPVDAYFEQVFVMCDDEATRQSRLALLRDITDLPSGIVNFALLPGF